MKVIGWGWFYLSTILDDYVAVHVYNDREVRRAIELGVMSIEHGQFLPEETARLGKEKGYSFRETLPDDQRHCSIILSMLATQLCGPRRSNSWRPARTIPGSWPLFAPRWAFKLIRS